MSSIEAPYLAALVRELVAALEEAKLEILADGEGRECAGCSTPWASIQGHYEDCTVTAAAAKIDVVLAHARDAGFGA